MSDKYVLNVKSRGETGNGPARRCRRAGMIPAVVYGHGEPGQAIAVCAKEFRPLAHKAVHLIDLVDENNKTTLALLKDMQYDYLKDVVVHLDFQAVKLDDVVSTIVAIHVVGTPAGVSRGGLFDLVLHEVTIACKAGAIPDMLTIDVSNMNVGETLHLSDIPMPEGATLLVDPSAVLCTCALPAAEESAATAEGEEAK